MTILTIHQEGAPILRELAREITVFDDALARLADNMLATMRAANGVGLAAPQIGQSIRLIVVKGTPWAMCNPTIERSSGMQRLSEGCLSVPRSKWGQAVVRPYKVHVRYQDLNGVPMRTKVSGQFAAIVAHETDHLDGILFIDKVGT